MRAITNARLDDAVIVVWGPDEDVTTAVNEIVSRIREATQGVPSETRQARPGGWTDFERLLAGPNRMYPDTDSPPTVISTGRVNRIREHLPATPWDLRKRLLNTGMSAVLAEQLVMSPYFGLYWKIEEDGRIPANRVARVLVQEIRAAKRRGGNPEKIPEDAWRKLFDHLRKGELLWEAVPHLIRHRSRRPGAEWLTIAAKQHQFPLDEAEWSSMIESLLHVPSRAKTTAGRVRWLMGQLQRPAGRMPGKRVAELLAEKLAQSSPPHPPR